MFYWLKKTFDPSINVFQQFQIGWFLGSAAFCSGAMWQPFVNWFQAPGVALSFTQAVNAQHSHFTARFSSKLSVQIVLSVARLARISHP